MDNGKAWEAQAPDWRRIHGHSFRRMRNAKVTLRGKTLTHWRDFWLLDLRHLLQHGPGDIAQQGVLIMGGHVLEDLLNAGVGGDWSKHLDGLGTDLRIAVVQDGFENGVSDVHVLGEIGSKAAKRLRANVG